MKAKTLQRDDIAQREKKESVIFDVNSCLITHTGIWCYVGQTVKSLSPTAHITGASLKIMIILLIKTESSSYQHTIPCVVELRRLLSETNTAHPLRQTALTPCHLMFKWILFLNWNLVIDDESIWFSLANVSHQFSSQAYRVNRLGKPSLNALAIFK